MEQLSMFDALLPIICEQDGYGHVMHVVSDAWRKKDPVGAKIDGPCYAGRTREETLATIWRNEGLAALVPDLLRVIDDLLDQQAMPDSGAIGPDGAYYKARALLAGG